MIPKHLHHAYLFVGGLDAREEAIKSFLSEIEFETSSNPDYSIFSGELFGIDEAREVSRRAGLMPFGERKVIHILPDRLTIESQNALLKLLEEPVENTHFLISAREKELFIPTLLSRVQIIDVGNSGIKTSAAKLFLEMPLRDRIQFARDFAEGESSLPGFIDELLASMREEGYMLEKLEKVFNVRKFADDRSALPRLLLEHIALVV